MMVFVRNETEFSIASDAQLLWNRATVPDWSCETVSNNSPPILLAVTKGWSGKEHHSFAKVMRQVKARLIEARGAIQVVVVFCDCWDSASFEEEHREEVGAFDKNGVRFVFLLVGVPDTVLVRVPVEFARAAR